MKTLGLVAVAAAAALNANGVAQAREMVAGSVTGLVSSYSIATPDLGACRLQGISTTSDNFKNYASVSAKDSTLNEGCARCIKVTRDDDATKATTAFVLDVCQGCAAGTLKLSQTALTTLAVDVNSNNVSVTYKYVQCPSSYMSGNIKACLMEGASNAYIPLQFYNSQKVISSAKINGVEGTSSKDSYLFSATSGQSKEGTNSWFSNITVELTSVDNETLTGSFAFGASSGCSTYTTQFSAASTSDGKDSSGSGSSSSGSSSALVPALVGGIAALFLIIGSVFFIRRRRMNRAAGEVAETPNNDVENQYLTPKGKPSPAGPTYTSDHSSGKGDPEPRSPTIDYAQSFSPAASFANTGLALQAAESPVDNNAHSISSGSVSMSESTQSYTNQPTYSFSSSLSNSPRRPKGVTVATFQAPVVPTYAAPRPNNASQHPGAGGAQSFSDEENDNEGRSSFDIDDMRNTEEMKSMDRGDSRFSSFDGHAPQPYSAPNNYATTTVTSPQSYVRATSLRRNTATRAPNVMRSTSSANSDAAPHSNERQNSASFAPGSLRETSGYRRDSLSILGYPYAKKNNRNGSVTG
ncbi:hypothetical protein Gpo141_00002189 [Globisporangium polare]